MLVVINGKIEARGAVRLNKDGNFTLVIKDKDLTARKAISIIYKPKGTTNGTPMKDSNVKVMVIGFGKDARRLK